MNTSLEQMLRHELVKYLAREMSLKEFEDWFVSSTWNQIPETDSWLRRTVDSIELALAEHSNGDWDESELRNLLRDQLDQLPITIGEDTLGPSPIFDTQGVASSPAEIQILETNRFQNVQVAF